MKNEENFLEDFKKAIISTVKSISQQKDCEIKFGSSEKISENSVNLPEIKKLDALNDIINVRASADSEALRLKYSNKDTFDLYKPHGEISEKLYKIAEKIRYEKIGSEEFFPPEISTSPLRGIPPWIKNFSIQLLSLSSIVIAFMDNA